MSVKKIVVPHKETNPVFARAPLLVSIKQAFESDGRVTALVVDMRGDYLIETRPHRDWGMAFAEAVHLAKVFGYQVTVGANR